jgi:nitroimidazol reductase NimA-like FMN-containing flavoprotein (pyridoxamine 5'-phosphate oxidase superfamily)
MTTEEALDPGGLDEIEPAECWRLLATQAVGRVAVIAGDYPHIVPVNFALDGKSVIFRSNAGTKLTAVHRSNVTFEVDELDHVHRRGWSVVIQGVAQEMEDTANPGLAQRAAEAGLEPWAPGRRNYLVRILADRITGRRIRPAEFLPGTDPRGYL